MGDQNLSSYVSFFFLRLIVFLPYLVGPGRAWHHGELLMLVGVFYMNCSNNIPIPLRKVCLPADIAIMDFQLHWAVNPKRCIPQSLSNLCDVSCTASLTIAV
jgi:hypothetical protein